MPAASRGGEELGSQRGRQLGESACQQRRREEGHLAHSPAQEEGEYLRGKKHGQEAREHPQRPVREAREHAEHRHLLGKGRQGHRECEQGGRGEFLHRDLLSRSIERTQAH